MNQMELPFALGAEVRLISIGDVSPVVVKGEITGLDPLQLETQFPVTGHLARDQSVLLVRQTPTQLWRVEAKFKSATYANGCWHCTIEPTRSWEIDRRLAPRFAVEIPVEIGFVAEVDGEPYFRVVQGTAVDMSATG